MLSSLATLQDVQTARAQTQPAAGDPRAAALEGFRRRNAALDSIFYDVSVISGEEARAISPWLAKEGALLHVPPTGGGSLTLCQDLDQLARLEPVAALAIAGVGSSALGSAAFARNVADAIAAPTVAIVSGYGLSDLVTEALGGWFFFGTTNRLRHLFEGVDDAFRPPPATEDLSFTRTSRDTRTTMALLQDKRFSLRLLTGHSKGNLVLSEALFGLEGLRLQAIGEGAQIVTVSATITMPRIKRSIIDIMGQWDWLGRLNSDATIPPEIVVPDAWHHTNRELPLHLPVTRTMRRALKRS